LVEQLLSDAILFRLDTAELADAIAGSARADVDTTSLTASISADREQLDELAAAYAQKVVPFQEWMTARKIIEDRMDTNQRKLHRSTKTTDLAPLMGQGGALIDEWPTLSLGRQRAIVDTLLVHAVVNPAAKGVHTFDPDRVHPVWRL
jgi:hypothetical protein